MRYVDVNGTKSADALQGMGSMGRIMLGAIARFSDRQALADDHRSLTYRELGEQIARAMSVLRSIGLQRGDGIAILSSNRVELVIVEFAAMLMGVRYTPLHPLAAGETHLFILEDAEISVVAVDPHAVRYRLSELKGNGGGRSILSFGPADDGSDLIAAMALAEPAPLEDLAQPDELVRLVYTGGTTGLPKGVMIPHRAMVTATVLQASEWDLTVHQLRFLATTPASHASGAIIPTVLMLGGYVRLTDGFSAEKFCKLVAADNITMTFLVPTMIYVLLDHPGIADDDLSCLQTIVYGAAPMSAARLRAAMQIFGPVFVQLYGQTEVPNCITALRKADHDLAHPERLNSCGLPSPMVQVSLFDSEMREVEAGQPGEICVRGPLLMQGYWKRPELTEDAFKGGWLHTGDVAVRSPDGYLTIVDRTKDMIISGGFNVYPSEVESALLRHPDVLFAAVIGVPDDKWGEAVVAYTVLRAGISGDAAALKSHVKSIRGPVWSPKQVFFVDQIPLTPLGKVDRKALRLLTPRNTSK
jgi:fatty-acyl-CoA synthase